MSQTLLITVMLAFLGVANTGERSHASESVLPVTRNWDVTFKPYAGKALETMPVQVLIFDVPEHGLVSGVPAKWVRQWQVVNHSNKTVVKIRRALFVAKEDDLDSLLIVRDLNGIFMVTLAPGIPWPDDQCSPQAKSCFCAFAIMPLNQLMAPLAQEEQNTTKYCVALGVDKVWFEDGSVWEFNTQK